MDGKQGYIQAGAGIVADSVPENEFAECGNKARAVIRAIERARRGLDSTRLTNPGAKLREAEFRLDA